MRTTALKIVLSFSLVLLNASLSTGQIQYNNIRFKQLSIAEGLPHNTINAITQDNHGSSGSAARTALCRFDGYNITCLHTMRPTVPRSATTLSPVCITTRCAMFYGSPPTRVFAATTTGRKILPVIGLKEIPKMMFVS